VKLLVLTAIYPKPDRPQFGSFVRTQVLALQEAGVDVDVLVLDGPNRKLIYPRGVAQLRRAIADDPPDLVHAHYSYVGAVARTQRRVPVVLTYHGDDILGTVDANGRTRPVSRAISAGGQVLGGMVDAVIVQTKQMATRFRRPDVHVIPHEVDLRTFQPTDRAAARDELGLDPDRHYALFAAPPEIHVKNFPLAERAVAAARASLPDLELIVVQREPQPRLALYMSACDVLAFSSWQEGSPNVVKQAMACNMPIVATDVGDVRELISATEGCHVVATEVEPFARALAAEAARRRRTDGRGAVAHLSTELVAARLVAVYEQVLGAPAPRVDGVPVPAPADGSGA
jgi:teichuronic acid biosynthesis glycosyltransferase TuaC